MRAPIIYSANLRLHHAAENLMRNIADSAGLAQTVRVPNSCLLIRGTTAKGREGVREDKQDADAPGEEARPSPYIRAKAPRAPSAGGLQ